MRKRLADLRVQALHPGTHPFIVCYGFEEQQRLTGWFGTPEEVTSATPEEPCARLLDALDPVWPPVRLGGYGRPYGQG